MFVPIKDDTPLRVIRFQTVTAAIIALNVVVFLVTGPLTGVDAALAFATRYGVIPAQLLALAPPQLGLLDPIAEPVTLITYQFIHGDWMHIVINMAFLWVFSDNIEDAFGHAGFAVFYLLCGVMAAVLHVMMAPESTLPLIGASGSVSGVLGAYMLLYPRARVWVLLFFKIPVPLPALWILVAWFAFQFYSLLVPDVPGQTVAWWAHIGGFLAGLGLTLILRHRLFVRG
ncbi:MAG: rhomboid family intramembrane serine protease [Proteobacteria bacterium]|nr:rhomboid family intramembrane serine protease [Pseudomonadota bacterium]